MTKAQTDLTDREFGLLVAKYVLGKNKNGIPVWHCECKCGNTKDVLVYSLLNDNTHSCGCLKQTSMSKVGASRRTHGHKSGDKESPEYCVWRGMKKRCTDEKHPHYASYGGRGIKVCDRWFNSFEAFLEDVGARPSLDYTLDRYPNNDGNYEPGNVRWATRIEQGQNTRANRLLEHEGEVKTLAEWARVTGKNVTTLHYRINRGWSSYDILYKPLQQKTKRGTAA